MHLTRAGKRYKCNNRRYSLLDVTNVSFETVRFSRRLHTSDSAVEVGTLTATKSEQGSLASYIKIGAQ